MALKVAFVGVGNIAQVHLKNIHEHEQTNLAAVCDINETQVAKVAKEYGANGYTDVDAMLDKEQPDVLYVCVPPFAHGQIEFKAAERGIHLFVEKPVELYLDVAREKAAAIRKAGIISAAGYGTRYLNSVQEAKKFLQDKQIAMVHGAYLGGFVETPWWRDMAKSGGQLVEQATHTVDLIRYLAGDVSKVYAEMALLASGGIEGMNVPDVGAVNLKFASGAVGYIGTTCVLTGIPGRLEVEIIGPGFKMLFNPLEVTLINKDETVKVKNTTDMFKTQDNAFIQAILTNNRQLVLASFDEGVKTLEVTLAANESASKEQPVVVTAEV